MRNGKSMRDVALPIIAAVLILAIASCGGEQDERETVIEAAKRYQSALIDKDANALCDSLTGAGKRKLVGEAGLDSCEKTAERVIDLMGEDEREVVRRSRDTLSLDHARLRGTSATVTSPVTRRSVKLQKSGENWLISDPISKRRR